MCVVLIVISLEIINIVAILKYISLFVHVTFFGCKYYILSAKDFFIQLAIALIGIFL